MKANPKSEIRNPKETRSPKLEGVSRPEQGLFGIRISSFFRHSSFVIRISFLSLLLLLAGCSKSETPAQRADAAKALFDRATKEFHVPSAEVRGAEQRRLQDQAAAAYEALLNRYPEQSNLCAQALRSLANIRAAQTNLNEAVRLYASVGQKYPQEDWEVLMAWKSAADLLWDANRRSEAMAFYQKIVARFDKPDAPQIVRMVVRGSTNRLAEIGK